MTAVGRFSTRPLYLQVKDMLIERILAGTWQPGAAIPNEIELSRKLGISVGTVRKALDEMEGERLISRRQGRGTFVIDQTSDECAIRFSNIRDPDEHPYQQIQFRAARSSPRRRVRPKPARYICAAATLSFACTGSASTKTVPS